MSLITGRLPNNSRVDFLVVGAQKSGTSALDHFLHQHPALVFSEEKEIHFFDRDGIFTNGKPNYALYHAKFKKPDPGQKTGEMTPSYIYFPHSAQRIKEYNPDIRLIFILRDPAERAFSHWNMRKRRGGEKLSFTEVIHRQAELISLHEHIVTWQSSQSDYIGRSLYADQIQRFWKLFPRKQMLFLKTEDLGDELGSTLNRICAFLNIQHFQSTPEKELVFSFAHTYEPMAGEDRAFLVDFFTPSVRKLEDILGWDCSTWLR